MNKNNRAFTLVEVLCVIMLIGILSAVATVSIMRYKQKAEKDEMVTVRSSIKSSFDTYRIKNGTIRGEKVSLDKLGYIGKLSFQNTKCTDDELKNSYVLYTVKGDLLSHLTGDDRKKACVLEFDSGTGETNEDYVVTDDKIKCKIDPTTGKEIPSKEELYCISFQCDGRTILNDFDGSDSKTSLCKFANE